MHSLRRVGVAKYPPNVSVGALGIVPSLYIRDPKRAVHINDETKKSASRRRRLEPCRARRESRGDLVLTHLLLDEVADGGRATSSSSRWVMLRRVSS